MSVSLIGAGGGGGGGGGQQNNTNYPLTCDVGRPRVLHSLEKQICCNHITKVSSVSGLCQ